MEMRKFIRAYFRILLNLQVCIFVALEFARGQDLRIDNQLRILANDCYTRIAIGSRLASESIISTTMSDSLADCESTCSKKGSDCDGFSFGVDSRGKASCTLGRINRGENKSFDFVPDRDSDIYEKRSRTQSGCQHDRLFKFSNLFGNGRSFGNKSSFSARKINEKSIFSSSLLDNLNSISRSNNSNFEPKRISFIRGGWYSPIADDDDTRLYDILTNKKDHVQFHPHFENNFEKNIPQDVKNYFSENIYEPPQPSFHQNIHPIFNDPGTHWFQNFAAFGTRSDFQLDKPRACYRKLMTGRRLSDDHVMRNVACERIEECHSLCEHESSFVCDGFNYGQPDASKFYSKSRSFVCGLTSSGSSANSDVPRNFIEDSRYDYYARDWTCSDRPRRPPDLNDRPIYRGTNFPGGHDRSYHDTNQYPISRNRPFSPKNHYIPNDIRVPNYYERNDDRSVSRVRNNNEKNRPSVYGDPFFYKSQITIDRDRNFYDDVKFPVSRDRNNNIDKNRFPATERGSYLPQRRPDFNYSPSYIDYYPANYPKSRDRDYESSRRFDDKIERNGLLPTSYGRFYPHQDFEYRPGDERNRWRDLYPRPEFDLRPGRKFHPGTQSCCPPDEKTGWKSLPEAGHRYPRPGTNFRPRDEHNRPVAGSHWRPISKPQWLPQSPKVCSVRTLMGFKLSRKILLDEFTVEDVQQCEMLCSRKGNCHVFAYRRLPLQRRETTDCFFALASTAFPLQEQCFDPIGRCALSWASADSGNSLDRCENFGNCLSPNCQNISRYSLAPSAPTANCLFSNIAFEKLNFYTDLEPERDYDVYAIMGDSKSCAESKNSIPGQTGMQRRSSEECFWRVRSDCEIPPSLVRKELRVENGLGECQMACLSSRLFTCRSFVFRYDLESKANCFLSDCSTREIIAALDAGRTSNQNAPSELYERGSYGRGCEPYPFAPIYNSVNFREKPRPDVQDCYSGYNSGCKLSPYAIASMSRVDTENECRRQCSRMRQSPHSPNCMSFTYRVGDAEHGDNCYLSDIPRRDLRPGVDYTLDDKYVTYAWKELEPQCSFYSGFTDDDPRSNFGFYRPENRPNFVPIPNDNPQHHPVADVYAYNTLLLATSSPVFDKPEEQPHEDIPNYDPQHPDVSLDPFDPDSFSNFNRHYTVSGYPCKRGTKCEMNKIAGFWSCEPEGAELGSWDYCCEPSNHCGYSQGYRYPWCYVGPSEDQWRPCSDKYYPYLPRPRPGTYGHGSYRSSDTDRQDRDPSYRPSAGNGRHWPIIFVHPIAPPNATDSVALPDNRRNYDDSWNTVNATNTTNSPSLEPENSNRSRSNSSSLTLQRHINKSHLKRRGLVSNVTIENNGRTKYSNDKVQITVLQTETSKKESTLPIDKIEKTEVDFGGLFLKKKNLSKVDGKINMGKIERVTKASETRSR